VSRMGGGCIVRMSAICTKSLTPCQWHNSLLSLPSAENASGFYIKTKLAAAVRSRTLRCSGNDDGRNSAFGTSCEDL